MYELEQQKENSKFTDFRKAFAVFEPASVNSLSNQQVMAQIQNSQEMLRDHMVKFPDDSIITNRLIKVLDFYLEKKELLKHENQLAQSLSSYHSVLELTLRGESMMGNQTSNISQSVLH